MEMMKMNKVEAFECASLHELCKKINEFAKDHEIIDASLATIKAGYTDYYAALVLYRTKA
jgi:hypothetical protein